MPSRRQGPSETAFISKAPRYFCLCGWFKSGLLHSPSRTTFQHLGQKGLSGQLRAMSQVGSRPMPAPQAISWQHTKLSQEADCFPGVSLLPVVHQGDGTAGILVGSQQGSWPRAMETG